MAIFAMTGFEAQQAATDNVTITGAACTISTVQHRTGLASLRANPGSGVSAYGVVVSSSGGLFHFGLFVASAPSVARMIFGSASNPGKGLRLNTDGSLAYVNDGNVLGTTAAGLISTGTWYWIGFRGGSGTSVDIIEIDGSPVLSGSPNANTCDGRLGCSGTEASAIDLYYDDFIFDTDSSVPFLAPSKVDIALPISDNTVTGVTDNNGVTTNIWQAVDNIPPAGVASANEAANPKAGMHFPASTTCDYIANLETYATLGVGAADTVLAVQSIVRHGEDIATGTKNLQNMGALTNPTVAGASVVAGLDVGAHIAESDALPNWRTAFGTLTTSPSVTLGTSPTIETSRTSQTRLACVDFMAMVVAWTPAPAAAERINKLYVMSAVHQAASRFRSFREYHRPWLPDRRIWVPRPN